MPGLQTAPDKSGFPQAPFRGRHSQPGHLCPGGCAAAPPSPPGEIRVRKGRIATMHPRPPVLFVLYVLSVLGVLSPLAAQDAISAGDAAYARRAEGHQGGRAAPGPINEAVAAYEKAVKEQPDRLEGYWKLL